MHALPLDRKRYLLLQNNQFRANGQQIPKPHIAQPSYAASYGPSSAPALLPRLVPQLTGDAGLMRRFSLSAWGSPILASNLTSLSTPSKPAETPQTQEKSQAGDIQEISPMQPQSTGGLWNSWWTSSGGGRSLTEKDSLVDKVKPAKWYIDSLRSGKSPDIKLVKHLISLRVHLSTAKLTFIEEFVVQEKGMDTLSTLLSQSVGTNGKRRNLNEAETMVLVEVIKCLRVLLNTEVCLCPSS